MSIASTLLSAAALLAAAGTASAFDIARTDNVVAYWGQNSHGASNPSDTAGYQKKLGDYCDDDTMDVFPISFLTVFFGTGDLPQLDLANICNANDGKVFPGSQLPDCSFLQDDIKKCQGKGKLVTLSMGGATGGNAFASDDVARGFADQIWNLFLGGESDTRPFGAAQLDGVDLDIEGGSGSGYIAFVQQLQSHYKGADKKYYVTAAPQCPFPDAILGAVLDGVAVDAVYVQFYNNYCGVSNYGNANAWNYDAWDNWAQTKAPNSDVKIYIGAPGAPGGANAGSYVDAATLGKIATETRAKYPKNFGGVMYWDASQAVGNDNFNAAIKNAIRDSSAPPAPTTTAAPEPTTTAAPEPSTEAPLPPTTTVAPEPTQAPGGGGEVPAPTETEDPCPPESTAAPVPTQAPGGGGEVPTPTETEDPCPPESTAAPEPTPTEDPCPPEENTTAPVPTETEDPCPPESTSVPTSVPTSAPTSAPTPAPSGGSCGSAKAWTATDVYTGGSTASYNGHVWTAKWWTQNETPGKSDVWTDSGACTSKRSNLIKARAPVIGLVGPTPVARYNPHAKRRF